MSGAPDDQLLAHLADDPDDRNAFAILADHLQQRGDPRGELIALQLVDQASPRIEELQGLLGVPSTGTVPPTRVRWGIGYIQRLELGIATAGSGIWSHPSLRLLRELRIGFRSRQTAPSYTYLAEHLPGTIRRLELADPRPPNFVTRVSAMLPRLDTLLVGARLNLDGLAHQHLCRLELRPGNSHDDLREAVAALSVSALPMLEDLTVWSRGDLTHTCGSLASGGWPARLRRLALRDGRLTPAGLIALGQMPDGHRLERLDITGVRASSEVVASLATLCEVLITPDGSMRRGSLT